MLLGCYCGLLLCEPLCRLRLEEKHHSAFHHITSRPIQFDADLLGQDLAKVLPEEEAWIAHYNKMDYDRGWSVLAIRSMAGLQSNIFGFGRHPQLFRLTPLGEKCSYIVDVSSFSFSFSFSFLLFPWVSKFTKQRKRSPLSHGFGPFAFTKQSMTR